MTPQKLSTRKRPDAADLLWWRPEPVTPAGRPAAGARQIVAAAFEIADQHGLHDISVKRVAGRLRVSAAVLNRYVASKDDLLDLMLDAALGEIELPPDGVAAGWRTQLEAIAHATQAVITRHPWLRSLAGTRTPSGPNGLRVSERTLAALAGLGLPPVQGMQLANTVLAYVYGFTQLEMGHRQRGSDADVDSRHRARTAQHLLDAGSSGDYPNLAALFATCDPLSTADAFDAGLAVVLDGLAAQLARITVD
jgi:AcrR family transcriptional regulator